MKRIILGTAILAIGLVAATAAGAESAAKTLGQDASSPYMRVYGRSLPPIGHVDFCSQFPADCKRIGPRHFKVELTRARKDDLREVNDLVNRMIRPVSDMDLYGRIENWTYPDDKGDCEDYVLLKQRLLIQRGWPSSALLITVVRDENDEGHAVLMTRTSKGDFLLDNKRPEIVTWNAAPYTFLKRQDSQNPKAWVSLTRPGRTAPKHLANTGNN